MISATAFSASSGAGVIAPKGMYNEVAYRVSVDGIGEEAQHNPRLLAAVPDFDLGHPKLFSRHESPARRESGTLPAPGSMLVHLETFLSFSLVLHGPLCVTLPSL